MLKRLEIALKPGILDAEGERIRRKVRDYFGWNIPFGDLSTYGPIRVIQVITFESHLNDDEYEAVRRDIFTNPVTQISSFSPLTNPAVTPFQWVIWVGFRPGVRDTAGSVALEAVASYLRRRLPPEDAAYTSRIYEIRTGDLNRLQVETIAKELLANELIQQWRIFSSDEWDPQEGIGFIVPRVLLGKGDFVRIETFSVTSDDVLARLSRERNLALHPQDIPVIRAYFNRPEVLAERAIVGLSNPTDVELEAISQARSDHCNHNTFRGVFTYRDLDTEETIVIDNLFKTCIEAPTLELQKQKDWVISVLWDNAGVAAFDEEHHYVITGETHNSPSNMEAYGGALTGIVGVYRDIMGTGKGAKLVGGLYGYCVGPQDYAGPLKPHLHPKRLLDGVVEGVRDGGNKHGVPTIFGNLLYHPSYLGKCLVFVASLGIMPRSVINGPCHDKKPEPGDLIVMCGGRVGKDGIHGVTASSEAYSEHTPVGHVQIGDPYTQKKMHDFLLEARDEGLISFITDNGGGGLSSSIGESARLAGGAFVELDKVPLKYEGLDPWEIWVSESQERMTVGIKPKHLDRFMELSRKHEVESTVIGRYENTGKLHLTYRGKTCAYLDLRFFEEDFPKWRFDAEWRSPESRGLFEPVIREPQDYGSLIKALLARPNICSREWIQRQYDHEVQGTSVIKPLVGRFRDIPSDAVVIRPIYSSPKGLAVTQALNPFYGQIDTYHMVAVTIDESVRRLIAVGGRRDRIGGVDNFCWPTIQYDPEDNPDGRYKAAQLVRANWALADFCRAYGIPLLSGKDSMYVDGFLRGTFGERHKVSGLPTMQFTATTIVDDVLKCLTMDAKMPGDEVYIVGITKDELGGSEYYDLFGYTGLNVPKVKVQELLPLYDALEKAIFKGLVASCHGIYRGGLAVHAALVAMAGWLGMELNLKEVPALNVTRNDHVLFSESAGRFIVTVPQDKRDEFEALFRNLCGELGERAVKNVGKILDEPIFRCIGLDGKLLFEENLRDLKRAWSGKEETTPFSIESFSIQSSPVNTPVVLKKKPLAIVLTGFGLNCDYETAHALEVAGAQAIRLHLNDLITRPQWLKEAKIFVIDGGFSWGDDHGAGVIMGCRLRYQLGEELLEFAEKGGLILGICNGFQVLVNIGLLPAMETNSERRERFFAREVALIPNDCGHFVDSWVWLKSNPSSPCIFTKDIDMIEFPVRHGEGKFYASKDVMNNLVKNHQIALQYARPDGSLAKGQYPFNPNGSLLDVAGICDVTGRIMGLMPHPEAFHHITNHPNWTLYKEILLRSGQSLENISKEGMGILFFRNAVKYWD
ncbi:MAG: phosphoribosylformylglycinamidine synthase subunit PurQ [Syntrophobacterales bacterium]|nr:phosphoribosylformylglycinamidine synthase subunit PurQ [Syntrophobacterales bacterium]